MRANPSSAPRFVSTLIVLTALLTSVAASATVMVYTNLARLVELSDVVVQGRVVDQDTFYDETLREVTTVTTVEVDHAFLGDVGHQVEFRQWGGEWGGRIAQIPGDAQFSPYEEVVLFLVDGEDQYAGNRYLTALGQSKYTIVRSGGEISVLRNLHDIGFMDLETSEISPRRSEIHRYDEFVAELEALVAGIKGGAR